MFEAWLPEKAKELEHYLSSVHEYAYVLFRKTVYYFDKKYSLYLILNLLGVSIVVLGLSLDYYFPNKNLLSIFLVGIIFLFLLRMPVFMTFWLNILMHVFHYFSYVTRGKPFMSIGILIAIFDVYSKEIISFIYFIF
ncbi:hypothetical protein KAOT1_00580 [Kordia algicida OT-1]|uniref:Uncharacterized protein n=2 Tax=Kordia TaxID=221065 RepID=A9EA16_9FLAO|nr:hypothetical protein KAOT1_00580 [Kordia algicida OT-1]